MFCEERARLNRAYLDDAKKVFSAGKAAPNMNSAKWRVAKIAAREVCKLALEKLERHRKEHGC